MLSNNPHNRGNNSPDPEPKKQPLSLTALCDSIKRSLAEDGATVYIERHPDGTAFSTAPSGPNIISFNSDAERDDYEKEEAKRARRSYRLAAAVLLCEEIEKRAMIHLTSPSSLTQEDLNFILKVGNKALADFFSARVQDCMEDLYSGFKELRDFRFAHAIAEARNKSQN